MMPILPVEGWQWPEASSHDPKVPEKDGRHQTGKVLPLRPTTTVRLCVSPAALPNPLRVQDRVCTLRECSTSVGQVTKNQSLCSQLIGDISVRYHAAGLALLPQASCLLTVWFSGFCCCCCFGGWGRAGNLFT